MLENSTIWRVVRVAVYSRDPLSRIVPLLLPPIRDVDSLLGSATESEERPRRSVSPACCSDSISIGGRKNLKFRQLFHLNTTQHCGREYLKCSKLRLRSDHQRTLKVYFFDNYWKYIVMVPVNVHRHLHYC